MSPIELSALFGIRQNGSAGLSYDRVLKVDDLLSQSSDDLGLDVDASGYLVLVEGGESE